MVATPGELAALGRAVELADRGAGTVLPNPVVGCVIVDSGGGVVGEGLHEQAGGPHAEIVALRSAGERARGATAVVTLEPCTHTGRTGPCTAALIDAGVVRVVVGVLDPWSPAAGGAEALRAAGVDVDVVPPDLAAEAEDVNRVWLTAVRRRRPFVTWKAGLTIDGRVAAADGTSRWITSAESRADVQALRGRVDTIMVGVGTVLADDPQLTARDASGRPAGRQPLRVVVDSRGRTPGTARVLDDAAETWIVTAAMGEAGRRTGRVDLAALVTALYERGKRHVLLEGGPTLAAAALDAGLVDEAVIYIAPLLLGAGLVALDHGGVTTLSGAHRAQVRAVDRIGPDVRLRFAVNSVDR